MIGTNLSHFQITAKLGEGGMGEVYRATDSKLGREVALKLLPELFAGDPDRMARFAREAQVLASLNHNNIAAIYGLEEDEGRRALVMELVEGETLSELLERGAVPVPEAARIGLQIAEALEAAHEKGIVHRDLKPANVKITPQGQVKVLDFGLAKALEEPQSGSDINNSPTLTAAATQAGIIMGTAAYMSPEQAAGSLADRRSDVWSFGVVLAELLTGKQQFEGPTVSHVLAAVLKDEPDLDRLPSQVPARIRELLGRCLRKDSKLRLQAIGEARVVLHEYLDDPGASEAPTRVDPTAPEVAPRWRRALPWALLALTVTALATTISTGSRVPASGPTRTTIALPHGLEVFGGYGSSVAMNPDGSSVAYVMEGQGQLTLYEHPLDRWEPELIATGTTGSNSPYHPFYSPDGRWLGFVTPAELKKVPVLGGSAITLCEVQLSRGASWGSDGFIVFAPSPSSGLARVSSAGGEPEAITELEEDETTHRWPQVLPGARGVLFTSHARSSDFDDAKIELLNFETRQRTVLHEGGSHARYIATGHVVYVREGTLFAIPFDLNALAATGSPFPVLEGVGYSPGQGGAHFDVSLAGRLIYVGGAGESPGWEIVWVDRDGQASPLWTEERLYRFPRISPDGSKLLVEIFADSVYDIWVYEIERGVPTRLTFSDSEDTMGVWTPDGSSIVFASNRDGASNLYRKPADGSGEAERLSESENEQYPWSISPDGRTVAYHQRDPDTGWDIWLAPLDGSGEATPFLQTEFGESEPSFSPDGRWIAYDSDESGSWEVYVRSADAGRGKWQISNGGGGWSRWARDGRELYYRTPDGSVMRVEVGTEGEAFRAARPVEAVSAGYVVGGNNSSFYDVHPDGDQLVLFRGRSSTSPHSHSHANLVMNWFEEIDQLLGSP